MSFTPLGLLIMPVGTVPPVKGMLRKKLFFDVTMGIGSGMVFALAFWYGVHIPRIEKRMY